MSMRTKAYLTLVVVVLCAVGIVWWMKTTAFNPKTSQQNNTAHQTKLEGLQHVPKPAKHGPYPKAVVVEPVYNFGVLEHGTKGKHAFVIRNEGEAPLELYANPAETTCQCTVAKVSKPVVPPGDSGEIVLTWHIRTTGPYFSHSALVHTNDPKKKEFRLRIVGWVGRLIGIHPDNTWDFGKLEEWKPVTLSGVVYSDLLNFHIKEVRCESQLVSAKWAPVSVDELMKILGRDRSMLGEDPPEVVEAAKKRPVEEQEDEFQLKDYVKPPKPKCGYRLTLTLQPEIPIGTFRERVEVVTDARDGIKQELWVQAYRPGPIEVISMGGVLWWPEQTLLQLGRFRASEGKKGKLSLFMDQVEGGLNLKVVEVSPKYLHFKLEKDKKFQSKKRVRFLGEVWVPPGAPPIAMTSEHPGKIVLTSNHPHAKKIVIRVQGVSF